MQKQCENWLHQTIIIGRRFELQQAKDSVKKTFKGNSLIYKELLHELGRLGFSVSAGYTSGGDVEYVCVSW